MSIRRTKHAVFDLKYYLVWIPKYRKHILVGEVAQYTKEVLQRIADEYGFWVDTIPDALNIFNPVPSNFAPDIAPEGKQLVTACMFVPFGFRDIAGLREAVIETMERLIPGLRKHVMWIDVSTPADLNKWVGENGAIIGVAQSTRQSGKNRPSVTTPIRNLYLCGAEAGGWGVGTELAVESARTVANLIA